MIAIDNKIASLTVLVVRQQELKKLADAGLISASDPDFIAAQTAVQQTQNAVTSGVPIVALPAPIL